MDDLISRKAAIDAIENAFDRETILNRFVRKIAISAVRLLPSVQSEQTRVFVELVVKYPDPELCTYKKYKGKPYYSIKYIENGETYVGYGTYNPEVLSQYLKEYFISSAQPDLSSYSDKLWRNAYERGKAEVQAEIIRCKDCKHYRHNNVGDSWCCHPRGLDGLDLMLSDFCSAAERK